MGERGKEGRDSEAESEGRSGVDRLPSEEEAEKTADEDAKKMDELHGTIEDAAETVRDQHRSDEAT